MRKPSFTFKTAFTMIELLVVISIILFLVALLMPALQRVRETAKNTKCMSNLRQIAMTTFVYASDYNGFAPWDHDCASKDSLFVQWKRGTQSKSNPLARDWYPQNKWFAEYFPSGEVGKMNQVAYCPKGGVVGELGPSVSVDASSQQLQNPLPNVSYGMNVDLGTDFYNSNGWSDKANTPLAQVQSPAKVALWLDSNKNLMYVRGHSVTGRHFAKSKEIAQEPGPVQGYQPYQYRGKVNVIFVDQHMSSLKVPEELPDYSCHFWNHTAPMPCDPNKLCKLCDKKTIY
jgi:type II secretory pathway pseudopilin PulG